MIESWEIAIDWPSTDPDFAVGHEFVGRQREVERRRALADATGGVVDRAVAGTEIAVVGSLMGDRDAAEVGTDSDQHLPLVVARLDPRRIGLRIRQLRHVDVLRLLDLLLGPVIDVDRLAAPEYL